MKSPLALIGLLISAGFIALLVVGVAYFLHFGEVTSDHVRWSEFGSYFGGLGGTIIAALALAALAVTAKIQTQQLELERIRHHSELALREIDEDFERAYESLFDSEDTPPRNTRLAWLSAARLILAAQKLSEEVSVEYDAIVRSKDDYWRYMFFNLLEPLDEADKDYWAERVEHLTAWRPGEERAPISEQSAKVIHDWIFREEWVDPMRDVTRFSDAEIERLTMFRWRGLGELLAEHRARLRRARGERIDQ